MGPTQRGDLFTSRETTRLMTQVFRGVTPCRFVNTEWVAENWRVSVFNFENPQVPVTHLVRTDVSGEGTATIVRVFLDSEDEVLTSPTERKPTAMNTHTVFANAYVVDAWKVVRISTLWITDSSIWQSIEMSYIDVSVMKVFIVSTCNGNGEPTHWESDS